MSAQSRKKKDSEVVVRTSKGSRNTGPLDLKEGYYQLDNGDYGYRFRDLYNGPGSIQYSAKFGFIFLGKNLPRNARMILTPQQAAELVPLLLEYSTTGKLPKL